MAFARRERCVDPGDRAAMWRMRVLRALCPCVFSQSRPGRSEDRDRAPGTVPAAVTTLAAVGTSLLKRLQDNEGDRVETYRELESVLQGDGGCLTSGVVNRLIAEASGDMRAAQGVTSDVKMAASDVLVALARSHFHFVMPELQSHLKAMGKVPEETVLLTLGKMARSYALRCIPFVGMTLLALRAMLSRVGSGRILHAACSALEQWSKAVSAYFCDREQRPFPRKGVAQLCDAIYPVFRYAVANWLGWKEEEDKQAVLGALAAMTRVLLHEEQHREHAWEQLLWILQQYQEVQDTSPVTKLLHRRGMEDLGSLTEAFLDSACFDDVLRVLKGWLTSAKEWELERALQVCAHVLGSVKERSEPMRGRPCKQFGSLVGLLGTLTSDCLATSRQRAWVCLGYVLQMQAKTMKVVPQADEIRCLCEKLNSPDTTTLVETFTKIAKAVCRCIPPAQATDFLTAVLDSLPHVTPTRARALWQWVFAFLVECRKEIRQEVPKILNTLYSYMQQSTHRPFGLHAVFLLARFQREPAISCLLQKGLPMDSDTVEVWRSLGGSSFGIQVLRCLVEKLNRAGNDCLGTDSSACERHDRQSALETVTITRAICEVLLALRSTEELRKLLPHLLPSLLRRASETLGMERLLSPTSSWRQMFLEGQVPEEKPCRIFLSAIKLALEKCMERKWMGLLMKWAVWAHLEDPMAHLEGLCLLSSVLLHAGLVSPCLVKNHSPWLDSCSVKLQLAEAELKAMREMAERSQHLEKDREEAKERREGNCLKRAQTGGHKETLQQFQARLMDLKDCYQELKELCQQLFQELEELTRERSNRRICKPHRANLGADKESTLLGANWQSFQHS